MIRIYGLCEPDTGEIRYVGQTSQALADRLAKHMRDTFCLRDWWHRLSARGLAPLVVTLAETDDAAQANALERRFITQLARPRLLNAKLVQRAAANTSGAVALARFLADSDMTQAQFAERMGVKQPHVSKWLHGLRPSLESAVRMSDLIGIPVTAWEWDSPIREYVAGKGDA